MKMTNEEIYNIAENFLKIFNQNINDIKLPVKINFFLQKNINLILKLGQEIENARVGIAKEYGVLSDDGLSYIIPKEKEDVANQELEDLFNLEQEVNIHKFKLQDFEKIELTFNQMSAILFMIDEE